MAQTALVYGGNGALGKGLVTAFKTNAWVRLRLLLGRPSATVFGYDGWADLMPLLPTVGRPRAPASHFN